MTYKWTYQELRDKGYINVLLVGRDEGKEDTLTYEKGVIGRQRGLRRRKCDLTIREETRKIDFSYIVKTRDGEAWAILKEVK